MRACFINCKKKKKEKPIYYKTSAMNEQSTDKKIVIS